MTDNDIIKALECCKSVVGGNCDDCPYVCCNMYGDSDAIKDAIALINRQRAEIERLTSGKCVYLSDEETTEYCVEGICPKYKTIAEIKAEAIKEFAKHLIDNYSAGGVIAAVDLVDAAADWGRGNG